MAGLNLIQGYSSDTDDETKNSNEENQTGFNVAKPSRLPLPESILSLKGVVHHTDVVDDPLKHQGRIRSFKHERGNWASLVYLDYDPSEEILQWMKNTVGEILKTGNLFEEFHVSLTRTLILKFHWIDSFVEAVKNIARNYPGFVMELNGIKVYCNDDKTRTFLGITVQSTNNSLRSLTGTLNKLLDEYQLPPFYEDALFHVSIWWCVGDHKQVLETLLPKLTSNFHEFLTNHPEHHYVQVDSLKCKIGNKLYKFNLR